MNSALQIVAIFHLTQGAAETSRNPIQDYIVYLAALVFLEDVVNNNSPESKENLAFLGKLLARRAGQHANARMLHAQLRAQVDQLEIQQERSA